MILAARGTRDLDGGEEPVPQAPDCEILRSQARRVHAQSAVLTVVLTLAAALAL